jgi:hypothetical protein
MPALHWSTAMNAITHSSPINGAYCIATIMTCHRGQEICREAQPAAYWCFVISGVVRRCVLRPDGRRQIVGLLLAGDFFGFTGGDEYDYTAEAVAESTMLASYPRRSSDALPPWKRWNPSSWKWKLGCQKVPGQHRAPGLAPRYR